MYPVEQDGARGPLTVRWLALALAWSGERDEAICTLQAHCAKPNGPDYGDLKLHPDWDTLRGDPRFEAMVASFAPKSDH